MLPPKNRKRRSILAYAGTAMIGSVFRPAAAAGETLVIDVSGVSPGVLPEGFTVARTGQGAPATWSVQEDASVPSRRVIAQTSTDQTDYRFPLAIYDKLSAANLDVRVRFKAVAGRVDRAGGIPIRFADPNNICRAGQCPRGQRGLLLRPQKECGAKSAAHRRRSLPTYGIHSE